MHGNLPAPAGAAISSTPGTGIVPVRNREQSCPEPGANPGNGTDDWFYEVAVAVFGLKETGWHLHHATGWPRTSCYAFVARDPDQRRKLSVEFLRILFRSEHGKPFRDAFMRGCEAGWWCEEQRAVDLGRGVIALIEKGGKS